MANGPAAPQEIELKLDLEPGKLEHLLAHLLLRAQPGNPAKVQALCSTYFDTEDEALRQAGVSLRIRREDGERIQTIKAVPSNGLALARSEWEQAVAVDEPDFASAKETALKPFRKLRNAIKPRFRVSVERRSMVLRHENSTIDVAVDRGELERREGTDTFAEVELELTDGNPADLFHLARSLADEVPLRLSFKTKSDRGFEALADAPPERVKADPVALKRRMTSADAFRAIAMSCLRHLAANESVVRQTGSPDAVHQMRVALRRLRAAITLFKDVVADEQRDAVKAELKWMANQLSEARDLDVYIAKVLEPAQAQHTGDPDFEDLLADYRSRRERAYEALQVAIASARFRNGVLDTARWIEVGPWQSNSTSVATGAGATPALDHATKELSRRWRKIRRRGKRLAKLDSEERHQVRIALKKLRYASEFFQTLFKGGGTRKRKHATFAGLEGLQETLGDLNDIAVGTEMSSTPAAATLQCEQISRTDSLLKTAQRQYRKLLRVDPYWKGI